MVAADIKEKTEGARKGTVFAISVSEKKGMKKKNVPEAELRENHGIVGDAHAGEWHRQISLLALSSFEKTRAKGLDVQPGDFAENLAIEGIDLVALGVGKKICVGKDVLLEVTQIGKECHTRCAIYYQTGDCVMPKEGIFARVLTGGRILPGDEVCVIEEG